MTWGKYSHLSTYHFLQALEAEGVHPDAVEYIRGLVSKIKEYENQQDEFDKELTRLQSEIDELESDRLELEEDLMEANELINELKSQLEKSDD